MKEIWTGIVSTRREDVASSCIHAQVFGFLFLGRSAQVRDVPHSNSRQECNSTIDHPVIRHIGGSGPMPEVNCESGGDPWKDGVGKGRKPNFASSNEGLNLGAMNPTGDIDQVMRHDD